MTSVGSVFAFVPRERLGIDRVEVVHRRQRGRRAVDVAIDRVVQLEVLHPDDRAEPVVVVHLLGDHPRGVFAVIANARRGVRDVALGVDDAAVPVVDLLPLALVVALLLRVDEALLERLQLEGEPVHERRLQPARVVDLDERDAAHHLEADGHAALGARERARALHRGPEARGLDQRFDEVVQFRRVLNVDRGHPVRGEEEPGEAIDDDAVEPVRRARLAHAQRERGAAGVCEAVGQVAHRADLVDLVRIELPGAVPSDRAPVVALARVPLPLLAQRALARRQALGFVGMDHAVVRDGLLANGESLRGGVLGTSGHAAQRI